MSAILSIADKNVKLWTARIYVPHCEYCIHINLKFSAKINFGEEQEVSSLSSSYLIAYSNGFLIPSQ